MKNRFFMASLGLVLFLALSFAACKHDSDATTPFEGTWVGTGGGNTYTVVFSGNNWTSFVNGANDLKGTFSYDATTFTRNDTHQWNGSSWVSTSQTLTVTYTIVGNTLTLGGGGGTYTRQ